MAKSKTQKVIDILENNYKVDLVEEFEELSRKEIIEKYELTPSEFTSLKKFVLDEEAVYHYIPRKKAVCSEYIKPTLDKEMLYKIENTDTEVSRFIKKCLVDLF